MPRVRHAPRPITGYPDNPVDRYLRHVWISWTQDSLVEERGADAEAVASRRAWHAQVAQLALARSKLKPRVGVVKTIGRDCPPPGVDFAVATDWRCNWRVCPFCHARRALMPAVALDAARLRLADEAAYRCVAFRQPDPLPPTWDEELRCVGVAAVTWRYPVVARNREFRRADDPGLLTWWTTGVALAPSGTAWGPVVKRYQTCALVDLAAACQYAFAYPAPWRHLTAEYLLRTELAHAPRQRLWRRYGAAHAPAAAGRATLPAGDAEL